MLLQPKPPSYLIVIPYFQRLTKVTCLDTQCEKNNEQTQNAYSLLLIVLIVVAAVVILTVVKLL